jgi:carbonic anhydrase
MTEPNILLPPGLQEGYGRFRTGRYTAEHERYRHLGAGAQQPRTIVIACSDSRAAPETIFDAGPGELFVVRNVAALVPVYEPDGRRHAASAALEYGVLALAVQGIVVMGHGRCGGIAAALETGSPLTSTDFVGAWVAGIRDLATELGPEAGADPAGRLALERASIEQSIANLRTFPWIRSREASGALRISGAWFDIGLGELHALSAAGWRPVSTG